MRRKREFFSLFLFFETIYNKTHSMEAIKITNERMNQVLPKEIIETDSLTDNAKKVLAVIINYHFVHEKAKTTGFLVISNSTLRKSSEMNMNMMKDAISELIECNLIIRESGKAWKAGEIKTASTYIVCWDNLKKEIKKPSFDELFESFSNTTKSPGTPIGSTTTTTSTTTSITNTSMSSAMSMSSSASPAATTNKELNVECNVVYDTIGEVETNKDKELEEKAIKGFKEWAMMINNKGS